MPPESFPRPPAPERPRAYSYVRFSSAEQARGDSLRRQTVAAERYAAKHGLVLDDELNLSDLGVSAFRGGNSQRGALAMFRRAVEDGLVPDGSVLLVENLDRLSREYVARAASQLQSLLDEGITVVTLSDERVHSRETYSGQDGTMEFLATILQYARAHDESRIKSERVGAAWANKRLRAHQSGERMTARGPGWLEAAPDGGWEIIEDRAGVVREIFQMAMDGKGKHQIAHELNARGVPRFGRAAQWHPSYIAKVLGNAAVVGEFTPHTLDMDGSGKRARTPGKSVPNYYPPVITDGIWAAVQSIRATKSPRGRHAAPGATVQSFLANLSRCPRCAGPMGRVSKGPRSAPKLVCSRAKAGAGCVYRSVDQHTVEAALVRELPALSQTVPVGGTAAAAEAALAGLEGTADGLISGIERLVDAVERGDTSPALRDRLRQRQAELSQLQQEIVEAEGEVGRTASALVTLRLDRVAQGFNAAQETFIKTPGDLDRGKLNALLKTAVGAVTVDYDAGLLQIEWLHGESSSIMYTFVASGEAG